MIAVLYIVALTGAYLAGRRLLDTPSAAGLVRRPFTATLSACAVVGAINLLQFAYPPTLIALRRDASAIAHGQPWRLLTALCVQDGGAAGTVFNLVCLLVLGISAERLLGTWRWVVVFAGGGLLSEIVALRWHPIGAGNSVANFSLAGAMCASCLFSRRRRADVAAAWVSIAAAAALLSIRDVHGAALFIGAILGGLLR